MTTQEMVEISFRVDADVSDGITGESLWAEQVAADRFRLANTPFYVRGVSYGDIVTGRRRGRYAVLTFTGISLRGGHSTFWIAVGAGTNAEVLRSRWAQLRELGCGSERSGRFFALDVPPATDFRAVEALLEEGVAAGLWDFEVAHCGHLAARPDRKDT